MALKKSIQLDNGIIVTYHRIVTINKITNDTTVIEVASYINEEEREKEKHALEKNEPMNVFIYTEYINKAYNEKETIEDIYEYLKTLEKYQGAEDI